MGLKFPDTIYDFALLNMPLPNAYDSNYWKLAQMLLSGYSLELSTYYLDKSGELKSIDDSEIPEESREKLLRILELQRVCKKYQEYYTNFSSSFDYIEAQESLRNAMRMVIGEKALSTVSNDPIRMKEAMEKSRNDLYIFLLRIASIMRDCRKGKEIIRIDLKTNIRYLKPYNPEPFVVAVKNQCSKEIINQQIKERVQCGRPLTLNVKDVDLFRKVVASSIFYQFCCSESEKAKCESGLDSYSLVRVWINRADMSVLSKRGVKEIHLDTMGGHIKDSVSLAMDHFEKAYLPQFARKCKLHRPETLRYLANKVPKIPYNTDGYRSYERRFDKFFVLLNVIKPEILAQLPYVEREFVILRFGLKGKFYSCPDIAEMLHVDLNLLENYYVKYLRLILQAIKRYMHQYIDMEAEQKVVLK